MDLAVEAGKIVALDTHLPLAAARVLDAGNALVLPGAIDLHTHLRSPLGTAGLFEGESAAAVAGGVTTLGDFAYPPGTRFEVEFEGKVEALERQSLCDFVVHTVVRSAEQLEAARTRTVKVFLAASGLGARAGNALDLVERAMARGHQVLVHVEALEDYAAIAAHARTQGSGRVHILHVPHQRFSQVVSGLGSGRVTMETCPQYLLWELTGGRQGCDVNPPIEASDLWPEIRAGRIQTIGTDHCSYTRREKDEYGLPGFPGLETMLRLMVAYGVEPGRISWADLCRLISSGPARVLDVYPRKGAVQVASDADLVLLDPDHEEVAAVPRHGRSDFSAYDGLRLKGKILCTLVRGRQVYGAEVAAREAAGWGTWQEPAWVPTDTDDRKGA
jgi:dihydropyrimidinase